MGQPGRDSLAVEGDIVVTPVAGHYAVGRVNADRQTQAVSEVHTDRLSAMKRACELAGNHHRVFLAYAERHGVVLVDCEDLVKNTRRANDI